MVTHDACNMVVSLCVCLKIEQCSAVCHLTVAEIDQRQIFHVRDGVGRVNFVQRYKIFTEFTLLIWNDKIDMSLFE